jgi:hemerythrin superfamily protein
MDAVDLIKQDHQEIDELFLKFVGTESDPIREDLFQQIQTRLNAHADMEERVLYPAVEAFASDQVEEALTEHRQVKQILAELLAVDVNEESFDSRFTELMDDVRRHVEEEESSSGILDVARQRLDAKKLVQMAAELRRIRRETEEDLAA